VQPHNEFRIHPHVVQIGCYWGQGGHTELYLVDGDPLTIIDTGVNDSPTKYLGPALESLGYSLKDVKLIVNTHGHYDHTGGNAEMVAASGAPLWIPEADARSAEDLDYQFETYFTGRHVLAGRSDRLEAARAAFKTFAGQATKVSRKLKNDEVLDFGKGIRLRVFPVPGHTPGSVCLAWESEGLFLGGDSMMGLSPLPGGLPLIYFPDDYRRSIRRLQELDIAVLALAHHYRTTTVPTDSVHTKQNVKKYLAEAMTILDVIEDAMRRAAASHPGADFLEVARNATDLLAARLPITKSEEGLPLYGNVESFYGCWKQMKGSS
jgi:glyoxylase-like metal-dependent hydrolase (beta-lactamase superfamily II)